MLKNYCFVCLDFETGGVDKKENKHATKFPITEVGLICFDMNFEEISRFSSYVKGQYNKDEVYVGYDTDLIYQSEALKHTGVTIEKMEKGLNYKEVVAQLIVEFQKCQLGKKYQLPVLVGHNITYDIPFLLYLFKFAKVDLSKYLSGYFDHFNEFQPIYLDTMWLSRISDPEGLHKHNLTDACKQHEIEHFDAHSAINDVIPTKQLMKVFVDKLRSTGTGIEQQPAEKFREHFHL